MALAVMMIGVLVLLLAGLMLAMAGFLLAPPRMEDGKALWVLKRVSPVDLGLRFEPLVFEVEDRQNPGRLKMRAWWLPGPAESARTAIIVHGYADAKVGGIAWARTLIELGHHVLAVDLRAHGESEGRQSTAGYFERHDLSQIIDQIRLMRPEQTRTLTLFGVSLGAAVAGAAAALRDDVSAVIMECPFRDYVSAAQEHADVMGMPGRWLQRPAIRLAEKLSRSDFDEVAPIRLVKSLRCPLMVIHGAADLFVSKGDMDELESAVRGRPAELGPTRYWRVADTHHVLALATDPAEFKKRVGEFLAEALREA